MEQRPFQYDKVKVSEAQKVGVYQQKVSRATLQLTAIFWEKLESGEHVVGLWYMWTMMKN